MKSSFYRAGTAHQFKSGGAEIGLPENFLRPRPLEPYLFLLNFFINSLVKRKYI